MSALEKQVLAEKASRNAVRQRFDARLALVREDLETRSVPGRVADKVGQEARSAIDEAIAVAQENKTVIAGTIAALAVWIFSNSLLDLLSRFLATEADDADWQEDKEPEA